MGSLFPWSLTAQKLNAQSLFVAIKVALANSINLAIYTATVLGMYRVIFG